MKKSVKIIFTISILLNLVLAGVIGGSLYKIKSYHRGDIPMELSDKTREFMKQNMQEARVDIRQSFKQMREQRDSLKDIISAAEFNQQAYDDAVDKILKLKDGMGHKKADMMGKMLSEMSQEERQKMSKFIVRGLTMDRPKPHGKDHEGRKKPFGDRPKDKD